MTETVHFETSVSPTGATFYTGPFVHAALAARAQAHLLGPDWDTYGVYILLGYPGQDGVTNAYVGQSTGLTGRMPGHKAKDFWTRVLMIQSPLRTPFDLADIGFLEGRLIEALGTSAELRLTNRVSSSDESVSLTRRQYLEEHVLPTVLAILGQQVPGLTLGTRTPQPAADRPATATAEPTPQAEPDVQAPVVPPAPAPQTATSDAGTVPSPNRTVPASTGMAALYAAMEADRKADDEWISGNRRALRYAQKRHHFLFVPKNLGRCSGISSMDRLTGHEILVYLDRLNRADAETGIVEPETTECAVRTGLTPDAVCDADERLIKVGLLTVRLPRDRRQPATFLVTRTPEYAGLAVPSGALWPSTDENTPPRWTGEDADLAVRALLVTLDAVLADQRSRGEARPWRPSVLASAANLRPTDYLRGLDLLVPNRNGAERTNGWLNVAPGPWREADRYWAAETSLWVAIDWTALPGQPPRPQSDVPVTAEAAA